MLQPNHTRFQGMNLESCETLRVTDETSQALRNLIPGQVLSIHQGLRWTGIRIKVGEHAVLRVRWPAELGDGDLVQIGQQVVVKIAPNDVLLGASGVWPGRDRWNRWTGRIVLVGPGTSHGMITVKVFGENWTLKSTGQVLGLGRFPQVWDTVNIVVDPAMARFDPPASSRRAVGSHWLTVGTNQTTADMRVWMKGRLSGEVSAVPSGWFLPLEIGTARVGAILGPKQDLPRDLVMGSKLELHIGQGETWLKLSSGDQMPVPCSLVYTSGDLSEGSQAAARSSFKE